MNTHAAMSLLTATAWLMCSSVVFAQPTTDKPKIVVGDKWQFANITDPGAKMDTWSRAVVEVPEGDRLRVKLGSGTIADYDGAMDWMPEGNLDYRRQLVAYPLGLGKEWSVARRFPNPSTSETGKARVAAQEQITVPAGTFQCWRIEAEASLVNKTYSERRIWTRWYCPEVKWIAKEIVETTTYNPYNPAANGRTLTTSELVRFTAGQ
jgi:hypothetical protein